MCMWLCVKICLWSVSTCFLFLLMINISSLTPPHTSPSMFSQRMPVEAVSCQGRQRAQLLHLAGTPHTSTFFLFPFHTGNDPHGAQWGFFFHLLKFLSMALWQVVGFAQTARGVFLHCVSAKMLLLSWNRVSLHRNATALKKTLWGFYMWNIVWERRGGQKDTVSPREQHCPSYHLSKDAADWPHVHCSPTQTHIGTCTNTHYHYQLSKITITQVHINKSSQF